MKTARQWSIDTHIPYATLRAAIRTGQLPSLRFTPKGQIFVLREEIEKFIEAAKTRAITAKTDEEKTLSTD